MKRRLERATLGIMLHISSAIDLEDLGVLRIRGADAVTFLQGQLSNDLTRLESHSALLAGYHNPQGRTVAVLRLVRAGSASERSPVDDILAVLPAALVAPVAARLTRFILRAKVRLADETARWRVQGLSQAHAPEAIAIQVSDAPPRWLALTERGAPSSTSAPERACAEREAWRLLDIAAGIPQVYAQTTEAFVAQMLNLDLLDGIAFSKGCYTGQEVIARAHYRGRVKRRMQRFRTLESAALAPGDVRQLPDGRSLRVVEAARLADG
ncbi:MAG: YgfZ/GcvT domain-containing protein, partial [Steroidobacteraceae bacterium]